jgi:CarD family transcriptional regulator
MSARGVSRSSATGRVTGQATLSAGSTAIYPGQGPCRIGRVVKRDVDGAVVMFYHLIILDDSGGELFIPVEKAHAIGVRLLMKKSEIPGILAHLKRSAKAADNWKQRATDNMKLFTSGSPYDLAEIVASLTELGSSRSLTLGESGTLDRARRLLISEISEVMGETKTEAAEQVDRALKLRIDLSKT